MRRGGGLITRADLRIYRAIRRRPLHGTYRGYEVLSAPPSSSGGTALIEMLNVLEGYDLAAAGFGSADAVHLTVEAMRRAYADRARHLGDPAFNPQMPIARLTSKEYAEALRRGIRRDRASASSPTTFEWPAESGQTTHLSVVDAEHNAVALTYTLEDNYGSKIVVPGARQAHALQHDPHDPGAGRPILHGPGQPRRPQDTQRRPAHDPERDRLRHEPSARHRRAPLPPSVASRPHPARAVGALSGHPASADRARAPAERPVAVRFRQRGAGGPLRPGRGPARGRVRPALSRRRRHRPLGVRPGNAEDGLLIRSVRGV